MTEDIINSVQNIDGIRELFNIGVGKAAGSLNSMTGAHITLQVPDVKFLKRDDIPHAILRLDKPFTVVNLDYFGSFSGKTALIFPRDSADNLIMLICGKDDSSEVSENVRKESLLEVGNILINAVMGSISNIIGEKLTYKLPVYQEDTITHVVTSNEASSDNILLAVAEFQVKDYDINGNILLVLDDPSIERLTQVIYEKMK